MSRYYDIGCRTCGGAKAGLSVNWGSKELQYAIQHRARFAAVGEVFAMLKHHDVYHFWGLGSDLSEIRLGTASLFLFEHRWCADVEVVDEYGIYADECGEWLGPPNSTVCKLKKGHAGEHR